MTEETGFPVLAEQGLDGIVVRFGDRLTEAANRAALALSGALRGGAVPGVAEATSALASVYVRFDGDFETGSAALRRLLGEEDFMGADLPPGRRLWRIPAAFGGVAGLALPAVARQIGMSEADAVRDLASTRVRVQAIGFAPGQPYLGPLGEAWDIPRLSELTDVPMGALAVAIRQMVMFTNASPTGWQPVGCTGFRCFRPESPDPFPLSPGDEIEFIPVSEAELARLKAEDRTGDAGAVVEALP